MPDPLPPAAWPAAPRPASHPIRTWFELRVPLRDGITPSADLTRPAAEGRYPTLVVRTPYNKNGPIAPTRRFLAERGYAVLIVDVRGRGDSFA